jgi:mono/diheme cytochrome c family protein
MGSMSMPRSSWAAGLVALATLTAAAWLLLADRSPGPAATSENAYRGATYAQHIQPIFNAACVSCHIHGRQIGGLDLAPERGYDDLVGAGSVQAPMLRVDPGRPEESYLLHKLRGTHVEVGGRGERMPMGGMPLSTSQIDLIETWIAQGARRGNLAGD